MKNRYKPIKTDFCSNPKLTNIDNSFLEKFLAGAKSALGILRGKERFRGLIPISVFSQDTIVTIHFNVPCPPLALDTIQVAKTDHYGFSVINRHNQNVAKLITIDGDSVNIHGTEPATDCCIRYAVNGDYMKSGNLHGPRGNLRDSDGNWCYQFDYNYNYNICNKKVIHE